MKKKEKKLYNINVYNDKGMDTVIFTVLVIYNFV